MGQTNKYASGLRKGRAMFNLVGEVRLSDYTYKMDELSKSGWLYHALNLGIDCGKGNVVYADMMGGHWAEKDTDIYVNSKEDFSDRYTIDWEDRFNDKILETVHNINFVRVGIEKDTSGQTFQKRFLAEYDAIEYIKEHLEEDTVVNIRGDLEYSIWNDNVQINKNIRSIFLSNAEPEDYRATFVQSILIQEDSVGRFDEEKGIYPIDAYVLDYTKDYNDLTVRTTIPFHRRFELEKDNENPEITNALLNKFFKVEKDVTEIVVEGDIIEGQETKAISRDDIPQDIKDLIEIGIYQEDEILNKMAVSGDRVQKYVIRKPYVQMQGDDEESRVPVLFIEKEKYKPEDLILDFMHGDYEDESDGGIDNFEDSSDDDIDFDDNSWLNDL